MSKRTFFTTVTPLPRGITRETVMSCLHDHFMMIDLNPLVEERHPIKAPASATPEEFHCRWYSLTDRVQYLPGGLASGKVTYTACLHDLVNGIQTHIYAPLGLNIKGKWTLGGNLPGEPIAPVELGMGLPLTGLWLREDVEMKCNFLLTNFVKGNLKKSHSTLISRMVAKAQLTETQNERDNDRSDFGSQRVYGHTRSSNSGELDHSSRSRVESWAADAARSTSSPPHQQSQSRSHDRDYDEDDASLRPRPLSIGNNVNARDGSVEVRQPTYSLPHQQIRSGNQSTSSQSYVGRDAEQAVGYHPSQGQRLSSGRQLSSASAPVELPQTGQQERRQIHELA